MRLSQKEFQSALATFQDALKYALILKAPREQSIAFGNLASAAYGAEDNAKVCSVTVAGLGGDMPAVCSVAFFFFKFGNISESLCDLFLLWCVRYQTTQFLQQQLGMLEELPDAGVCVNDLAQLSRRSSPRCTLSHTMC